MASRVIRCQAVRCQAVVHSARRVRYGRTIKEDGHSEQGRDDWLPDGTWIEAPTQEQAQTQKSIPLLARAWRPQRVPDGRRIAAVVAAAILVVAALWAVIAFRDEPGNGEPASTASTPNENESPTTEPRPRLRERTVLHPGDQGPNVRRLQRALTQLGYDAGPADGVFGRETARALRRFQRGARLVPDGMAGRRTLRALNRALER